MAHLLVNTLPHHQGAVNKKITVRGKIVLDNIPRIVYYCKRNTPWGTGGETNGSKTKAGA